MDGPRHFLSTDDLGVEGIMKLLDRAEEIRSMGIFPGEMVGKILGLIFFQPSTRTRFGFHAAMARLGGAAIELDSAKYQAGMSSAESVADTVRCLSAYCDLLVLRHGVLEEFEIALSASQVAVISGGAGDDQHPTQALIDLNAIRTRFGRIRGLAFGIVGDVAHSRAAKSLLRALSLFPPTLLRLVIPEGSDFAEELLSRFNPSAVEVTSELDLEDLEIIYMAGLPEVAGGARHPAATRNKFRLTGERAARLDPQTLILDPLPRIDEIDREVDELPQAGYFQQNAAGLSVRMAILLQSMNV